LQRGAGPCGAVRGRGDTSRGCTQASATRPGARGRDVTGNTYNQAGRSQGASTAGLPAESRVAVWLGSATAVGRCRTDCTLCSAGRGMGRETGSVVVLGGGRGWLAGLFRNPPGTHKQPVHVNHTCGCRDAGTAVEDRPARLAVAAPARVGRSGSTNPHHGASAPTWSTKQKNTRTHTPALPAQRLAVVRAPVTRAHVARDTQPSTCGIRNPQVCTHAHPRPHTQPPPPRRQGEPAP
jgi:hypothetical protein